MPLSALLTLLLFWQVGCDGTIDLDSASDEEDLPAVSLELISDGYATPLWGDGAPGNDHYLYVVDQIGTITAEPVGPGSTGDDRTPFTFLDVGVDGLDLIVALPRDAGFDERGLLGLAFHPDFRTNGLFYTYTSEPLGPPPDFTTLAPSAERTDDTSLSVIREWSVDEPEDPEAQIDEDNSRVLMRIEQPQGNHNGGALDFGRDDMLYIALGDGGARDDQGPGHAQVGNGQDLSENNLLGKIVRIDPLRDNAANGQYGIPEDNPFVDTRRAAEVFAYGFRNPFRMSFDRLTGDLYVADVGQADVEEVNIVTSGGNYGWPVKEGTFLFDNNGPGRGFATTSSPGEPADMIDPIAEYNHDQGLSVTGGFVYRGRAIPGLFGSYVFGDLTSDKNRPRGRLYAIDTRGELQDLTPVNADETELFIAGFGQDTSGELYVMGLGRAETNGTSGLLYQLVADTG